MYVRLKHALCTLALEAVRSPAGSASRSAVAWLAAYCDLCGGERFEVSLTKVAALLSRRSDNGTTSWQWVAKSELLDHENGTLSLPKGFRPYFPYMDRQVHRLAGVVRTLEASRTASSQSARIPREVEAVWKGIALFNGGLFFECHEYFEGIWRTAPPDEKAFYQGIILIAAGLYHYEKGNLHGARTKLAQGIEKLQAYLPASHGVRLDRWLLSLAPWKARAEAVQPVGGGVLKPTDIPRIPFSLMRDS
jgi:hypothetical protein